MDIIFVLLGNVIVDSEAPLRFCRLISLSEILIRLRVYVSVYEKLSTVMLPLRHCVIKRKISTTSAEKNPLGGSTINGTLAWTDNGPSTCSRN